MPPRKRPLPTPAELAAALNTHGSIKAACEALGHWRDAIYRRPELRAVLDAWQRPTPEGNERGLHEIALRPAVLRKLNAVATVDGRLQRSAAVRGMIREALTGDLPPPDHREARSKTVLELGDTWDRLAARIGTTDPRTIAGVLRAIIAKRVARAAK